MMYEFSRLRTGRRLVELPPVFFLASEEWLLLGFEFESVTGVSEARFNTLLLALRLLVLMGLDEAWLSAREGAGKGLAGSSESGLLVVVVVATPKWKPSNLCATESSTNRRSRLSEDE